MNGDPDINERKTTLPKSGQCWYSGVKSTKNFTEIVCDFDYGVENVTGNVNLSLSIREYVTKSILNDY